MEENKVPASLSDCFEEAVVALNPSATFLQAEKLLGGVSASVYRLDFLTASQQTQSVVFRQHRNPDFKDHDNRVASKEFALLEALHAEGLPVPQPLLLEESKTESKFFLSEYIDGTTLVVDEDLPEALDQMARFLAKLHSFDASSLVNGGLEPLDNPWNETAQYLPETNVGDQVRSILDNQTVEKTLSPATLVHCDYWPGNVLWKKQKLAAVIDWEDACLGDPLADLATAKVELCCQYGVEASNVFANWYLEFAQKESVKLELSALPIWDVYVSATALSSMGEWGLAPAVEANRRKATELFFNCAVSELCAEAAA